MLMNQEWDSVGDGIQTVEWPASRCLSPLHILKQLNTLTKKRDTMKTNLITISAACFSMAVAWSGEVPVNPPLVFKPRPWPEVRRYATLPLPEKPEKPETSAQLDRKLEALGLMKIRIESPRIVTQQPIPTLPSPAQIDALQWEMAEKLKKQEQEKREEIYGLLDTHSSLPVGTKLTPKEWDALSAEFFALGPKFIAEGHSIGSPIRWQIWVSDYMNACYDRLIIPEIRGKSDADYIIEAINRNTDAIERCEHR